MNEIKELKNSLRLTTKEFAELFEIPYNTVRQWINGERNCPAYIISMLKKLIEFQNKKNSHSKTDDIYYGLKIVLPTGTTYYRLYDNKSGFQKDLAFEKGIQALTRKTIIELKLIELQEQRVEHQFQYKQKLKGFPEI